MMNNNKLYGAIYGDIVGKPFEKNETPIKASDINYFPKKTTFSDDTIMTLASAHSLNENKSIQDSYKYVGSKYLDKKYGYGKNFRKWLEGKECMTNSYGNGCLMRIAPFIWTNKYDKMIYSVRLTHNHPNSILSSVKLFNLYKNEQKYFINYTNFDNQFHIEAYETYQIIEKLFYSFVEQSDYNINKKAVKKAILIGGDTDTNASIFSELVNYKYNLISNEIKDYVESKLDDFLLNILIKFNKKY